MSRTRRKAPPWMRKNNWNPKFIARAERGLVPTELSDDVGNVVWSPEGKRVMKRLKIRADRRVNKTLEIE